MRATISGLGLLTGDTELRVERSLERCTIETEASLLLLPWPGRHDFRGDVFGSCSDELAAVPHCPIAAVSLASQDIERVLLHVPDTDLTPGRRGDVRRAVEVARNVAEAERLPLMFGPADRTRLDAEDLEIPASALRVAGPGDALSWAAEHAGPTDLCVVAAGSDPFALLAHLADRDRSAVDAMGHRRSGWYSTEGPLGVGGQRTSTS